MPTRLDRYRALEYPLPERTLVWQLSGAGFESFALAEIPRREPGPGEIAFRVDTNSICFSDVKVVKLGPRHPRLAGYDMARDKVVLGHEISVTVTGKGAGTSPRIRVGGRYIVQADLFEYNTAVGYAVWGGMIQYGIFDRRVENYLIPIEGDIGYSAASLVEPWACVEASYARCDILPTDRAVWIMGGGGPMGQMHILRTLGAKRLGRAPGLQALLVTDVSEERLGAVRRRFEETARAVGVSFPCLNPAAPGFDEAIRRSAPRGIDYIVACVPVPEVVVDCRKYLNRYGVLNIFAGLARGTGPVCLGDIHYDQHTFTGNTGSRLEDMVKVLRATERGEMDTDASAAAVVGMRSACDGVRAVAENAITNKIVIYPQLADLPLLRIEELPRIVPFSPGVRAEVEAGRWSKRAEAELLEALLPI